MVILRCHNYHKVIKVEVLTMMSMLMVAKKNHAIKKHENVNGCCHLDQNTKKKGLNCMRQCRKFKELDCPNSIANGYYTKITISISTSLLPSKRVEKR